MDVGELPPLRHVVGVADPMGHLWPPPAELAPTPDLGHPGHPPLFGETAHPAARILLNTS